MVSFNSGDRKILVLLLVMVLSLMTYLGIHGAKLVSSEEEILLPATDTIVIDTSATPDSLQTGATTTAERKEVEPKPRADSLAIITTDKYPGPPTRPHYPKKLGKGATIDLNSADTLLLMRVPGIGPTFARRIYKYRELLGGYYVVEQLQEVYDMDRERYQQIVPFLKIETAVKPIYISRDSIGRHPYLQWRHKRVMEGILRDGQKLTWDRLMESRQFTKDDSLRLSPYMTPYIEEIE